MAKEPGWIKMSPAQRMTNKLCPECGADLTEEDALHHRQLHWEPIHLNRDPKSQANVRATMLDNFIKSEAAKAQTE